MKTLKKILIKEDDKLEEREKAREKVLKAQRDMMNEKIADMERRRVNMDDINSMLKARLQKDIEISEYELEKSKKNNIFEDPMIKAIRQKQVILQENRWKSQNYIQEDEETTLERIRRKREERRRRDREEQQGSENANTEKADEKAERDPAERRAKARAEREKLLQGKIKISINQFHKIVQSVKRSARNSRL